jgi:hypothetical protein
MLRDMNGIARSVYWLGYKQYDREIRVRFPVGTRNFFPILSVYTCSWGHQPPMEWVPRAWSWTHLEMGMDLMPQITLGFRNDSDHSSQTVYRTYLELHDHSIYLMLVTWSQAWQTEKTYDATCSWPMHQRFTVYCSCGYLILIKWLNNNIINILTRFLNNYALYIYTYKFLWIAFLL